jgi:peptide/nickel transport system permease protein
VNLWVRNLKQLREYPSAVAGLTIIAGLILMSVFTVIAIPYNQAILLWRGGANVWEDSPKNAWPVWYSWFKGGNLPQTIIVNSRNPAQVAGGSVVKTLEPGAGNTTEVSMTLQFDFPYSDFPPEMTVFLSAPRTKQSPHVTLTWVTPDGREKRMADVSPTKSDSYRFMQDRSLQRRLGTPRVEQALFGDPATDNKEPLNGTYQLRVHGLMFEEDADLDAKLVVYGTVAGWAGTDNLRRDLSIALLWGTPIALAFGLIAAVGTTITTMSIAALGVWYGGSVDGVIQRITEVNLVLPVLPILIMIGTFYSRSIWVVLGVVIMLSIFGAAIKSYRAIFLQVRTLPYIEAAQAYGASNRRIVFRYLIPRVLPLVVPNLVILVPAFVFLEASLAVLGLGDPVLPTWGKVIQNAQSAGALFNGYYYWILEPAALLILAGLAFAMVGFALDRMFNPRLREL